MSLANEGELDILGDWLRDEVPSPKYLALLSTVPRASDTLNDLAEVSSSSGYSRQVLPAAGWAVPVLTSGDYRTTAGQLTYGPAIGEKWTVAAVAVVTAASGTVGRFLLWVALRAPVTVEMGQLFRYTLTVKAK
jgi:hypothetical protein